MNKRIQELANQCYETGPIGKDGWPEYSRLNEQKFAVLIARECMYICEQQRVKILNNPNDPSWTEHLAECQTTMEQTFLRS